jgi:hypothetical protein
MDDLPVVFRLDPTPVFGAPVFSLTYRVPPRLPPWWRRWWTWAGWAWRQAYRWLQAWTA